VRGLIAFRREWSIEKFRLAAERGGYPPAWIFHRRVSAGCWDTNARVRPIAASLLDLPFPFPRGIFHVSQIHSRKPAKSYVSGSLCAREPSSPSFLGTCSREEQERRVRGSLTNEIRWPTYWWRNVHPLRRTMRRWRAGDSACWWFEIDVACAGTKANVLPSAPRPDDLAETQSYQRPEGLASQSPVNGDILFNADEYTIIALCCEV